MSKEWFEWYIGQTSKEKEWPKFRDRYLCPCCFMPTLEERNGYDICPICFWEDDGQDSDDAGIVRGGPNHDYSLSEARANFVEHKTMYRKSDVIAFEREMKTKEKRMVLYEAFSKALQSKNEFEWKRALKVELEYREYYEELDQEG